MTASADPPLDQTASERPTLSTAPIAGPTQARLLDADVLTDFRAALATFEDEARGVLDSVGRKTSGTLRWLDDEAPLYWAQSQRKASDAISSARTALDMCKMRTVAGHRSSCIEEKQALARAKDREEFCHAQRNRVRGVAHAARHSVDELAGRLSQLERWLDGDLPKLQARLHRTAKAIEAYAATAPVRAAGARAPAQATQQEEKPFPAEDSAGRNEPSSEDSA